MPLSRKGSVELYVEIGIMYALFTVLLIVALSTFLSHLGG